MCFLGASALTIHGYMRAMSWDGNVYWASGKSSGQCGHSPVLCNLCLSRSWFSICRLWCFSPDRGQQVGCLQRVPHSERDTPKISPLLAAPQTPDTGSRHVWPQQDLKAPLSVFQPCGEPPRESAPQVSGRPPHAGATRRLPGVPGSEHGCDSCSPQLPGEASATGGQGALLGGLPGGSGPGFPEQQGSLLYTICTGK